MRVDLSTVSFAGLMILAGAANIFYTREVLELDKLVMPRMMFQLLENIGFARPKVVRIFGVCGIFFGLVIGCLSFFFPI